MYQDLARIGRIINFKLKQDKTMMARKFCYVTYSTPAEARKAVDHVNSLNFVPQFRLPRRPRANLHEPPRSTTRPNGLHQQAPVSTVTKAIILIGDEKLPQLSIVKLNGESFINDETAVHIG